MEFRVLAIGDVTSEEGTAHLRRHLPGFKKMKGVDFTVINGENISGTGLTPQQADDLFAAGADVITLGNHTWGKMQITDYLEDNRYILRPANFSPRTPGRGYGVYDLGRVQVAVLCLIGRCDLAWGSDNPFTTADRLLKAGEKLPLVLRRMVTMVLVMLGWALFYFEDLGALGAFLGRLFTAVPSAGIAFYLPVTALGCLCATPALKRVKLPDGVRWGLCVVLLLLCVASLARQSYNPFIYFRF